MTRLYVAAPLHLIEHAREVAALLSPHATITSTWHAGSPTIEAERVMSDAALLQIGGTCKAEIDASTALLLLYGDECMRHGHILEAGYAVGCRLPVAIMPVVGGAEMPTRLMPGFGVARLSGVDAAVGWVRGLR